MARTPKNLDIRQLATTTLTEVYKAPSGINTTNLLIRFTNTSTTSLSIDVFHTKSGTNFLIETMTLPAGSGQSRIFYGLNGEVINAAESIKIQANSAAAFNSSLNGSEIEL